MLCLWCGREPVAVAIVELPRLGRASWPACDHHRALAAREVTDALNRLVVPGSSAPPSDVIDTTASDDHGPLPPISRGGRGSAIAGMIGLDDIRAIERDA